MDKNQQHLANLHTFSVAAKLLSFTKASEELFITQGAVSQRIKTLETQLGFMLFIRKPRRLLLTAEGERLLQALTQSFDIIFSEIESIRANELRGELYLGAAPTFAQNWLLPHLARFQRSYPHLNLKLRVKASRLDFEHEPVDMAIYYSDGQHPGFYSKRLFAEHLTPVCSPDYYQQHFSAAGQGLSDFAALSFIHCSESLASSEADYEWKRWLKLQTNPALKDIDPSLRSYRFNHGDMALQAAVNGIGMAMGRVSLMNQYLENGSLVAPFESVPAGLGYDLICPSGLQQRPRNAALIGWLFSLLPKE